MPASRKKPSTAVQNIAQYIYWRQQEIEAKKQRDKFRKAGNLDDLVTTSGEETSDGGFAFYLDDPIPLENGKVVIGLEKRRSVQVFMDEEAAEALAIRLGITEDVSHMERVFDEDLFYAANQRGIISDDDLDSLLIQTEEFSLQVVTE